MARPNNTRRPATAADIRVTAKLDGPFAPHPVVTLSLVNGRQVDVVARVACHLDGSSPELLGGEDLRARDGEAHPASLARMLELARPRIADAVRAAVAATCDATDRKAAEERADGDEDRAAKLEGRAAYLRQAAGLA